MDGMIEQVRLRAYELWQMNGMRGCDVAHWTAAEVEIRAKTTVAAPAKAKKPGKAAPKSAALKSVARKATAKKEAGMSAASAI